MPKQSPTQREDREQNLLDAAYRLFMSKGQPKTSIDDIVQEAQVAKGSFYTYFKNKDDLTQKLVDRLCTRILRESYAASRQMPAADFADRVVHLMDQIIEHFKRNKLQLYLIRRNFSWPMVEHELSQPSDPVWQDLASALEHSPPDGALHLGRAVPADLCAGGNVRLHLLCLHHRRPPPPALSR